MRTTALVLGVVGGVVGLSCGTAAVQAGALVNSLSRVVGSGSGRTFNGQQLVGAGAVVILVSIAAVVGAGLAVSRPRAAAAVMSTAAVAGLVAARADYVFSAAMLGAASILTLLASGVQTAMSPSRTAITSDQVAGAEPYRAQAPLLVSGKRSTIWLARGLWAVGVVLAIVTWWFWILALFALLLVAAVAWIPRVGERALRVTGWYDLPYLGRIRGWRATAVLVVLAILVVIVGGAVAPRPPAV